MNKELEVTLPSLYSQAGSEAKFKKFNNLTTRIFTRSSHFTRAPHFARNASSSSCY